MSFKIDCNIPVEPIADGKIHRFKIGNKSNKNGWYLLFPSGKFGVCGDWSTGEKINWRDGEYTITEADKIAIKLAIAAQAEAQQLAWQEVADKTLDLIADCERKGNSGYLTKKKILPNGALFNGNKIVLPLQDSEGKIWTYQEIFENGDKLFASGGKIKGCYFPIYPNREIAQDDLVVVCEGFATGASIHQATDFPVICAMNAGNIKAVCNSLPYTNIIIAADNDASGIGEAKAKEVGKYVMPANIGEDFSDLWIRGDNVKSYFVNLGQAAKHIEQLKVGGLVGAIAEWITETAIKPQPQLSLAASLAFVSMLKGHRVCGTTNLHPNLYVMMLAKTGTGKEHPFNCISWLSRVLKVGDKVMGIPASGSACATGLRKMSGAGLLPIDEFGRFLSGVNGKNSQSHEKQIIDFLISIYSKSGSTYIGKQYANEKENPQIILENPYLSIVGATVRNRFLEACDSEMIIDGFLNRWIIFETDANPESIRNPNIGSVPNDLIAKIKKWLAKNNGEIKKIGFTDSAFKIFMDYQKEINKKQEAANYPFDALYSRLVGQVEKVSLTLCDNDIITDDIVKIAISIVTDSHRRAIEFAKGISNNQHEADLLYILDIIKRNKRITKSQLTRQTQKLNQKIRNDIISQLFESGQIIQENCGNGKTNLIFVE